MSFPTQTQPVLENEVLNELVKREFVSRQQLDSMSEQSKARQIPVLALLEEKGLVREDDVVKLKSELTGIPYVDLYGKMVRSDTLNLIPQELAENYQMVAYNREEQILDVAMVDPQDYRALEAIEFIARKNRLTIRYAITTPSSIRYLIRQYASLSQEVEEALKAAKAETKADVTNIEIAEKGLEEVVKKAPVSKMVSVILRHAVEGRASDVHIEPVGNETRVRYRIDGVLHTSIILPKNVHTAVVARIKVLSNMKIDETRIPQDGRFRMTIDGKDIDYRVSTLPLINNEKVVMRILDTSSSTFDLESLGFVDKNLEVMRRNIDKSHGMFLTTGPTGSGKSTTLYGLLTILNRESVNIVTLEDPVEYYLKGIAQSQINPEVGLTFAAGLRSILRQDPDIIMVGEIRDNETAELAIHASLTGHIVLSTLHTNDAFGAIPRLVDMKIEPFLVTSSMNVVIAQRLVRRICQFCIAEMEIPEQLQKEVRQELTKVPAESLPKEFGPDHPLTFYRGKGCTRCEHQGYKGRVAIAEVLEINPEVKKIIGSGENVEERIKQAFVSQGMVTMKQDGLLKALRKVTTIEEVWNVTRE
ncbi:MAG: Flp pilus assembly complex ATPase component TadA [Candidatus Kerfeldbacteria bacterium]|nr:Flp pilus assembly complex ATPase component TadA [Candidatus Kerfeldbacteria bacterium]